MRKNNIEQQDLKDKTVTIKLYKNRKKNENLLKKYLKKHD
jgi:hypothetical protein